MTVGNVNNYMGNQAIQSKQQAETEPGNKNQQKQKASEPVSNSGVEKNIRNQDVSNYYSYLQKNYEAMQKSNVNIDGEYLKQCVADSAKAKELEDFIKKIPELEEQGYKELAARNKALGGTVTHYQQTWTINKDGSVQSSVYSVTETEMTNAERMKKNIDERLKKQKEKKAEEEDKTEKSEEMTAEKVKAEEISQEKIAEEEQEKEKQTEGLKEDAETLNGNRLYQSMILDYTDASTMEDLQLKIQNNKPERRK